jgi:hypothetical protein
MKGRRSFAFASLIALATAAAAPVHAQLEGPSSPAAPPSSNPSDNRALAEMLFFTARGLMEAGRYSEACGKLQESYRLDAAAGTLLNMAVCHEKIGKIASAWGEFREAAADAKRMNRADREQVASEREAAIEPELPFLAITVPPQVARTPGLVVSRNGVPLMSGAWNTELPVDPGDVEVVEKAPGYKPKTLTVEGLELKPIEIPPQPFWTGRRSMGALIFVGGVGLAAGGTVFGVEAINEKKDSDVACPNWQRLGALRCTQAGVDDMSKANTFAWISDLGFGLGAVAAVAGAYFFITGDKEGPSRATTGKADWTWQLGPTPGGARGVVSRSF